MKSNFKYLFGLICLLGIVSLTSCDKDEISVTPESDCSNFSAEIVLSDSLLIANASNGTAPLTYLWSTGETVNQIFPTSSGDFSVTVTDADGCAAVANYEVAAPCMLAISQVTSTETSTNNYDLTPALSNGTAPYVYTWSTGATSSTISVTASAAATTYTVEVSDANGCNANGTVTVSGTNLCSNFATDIYLVQDSTGTSNIMLDAGTSGGTAPFTWNWSTGESTGNIQITNTGTYSVTATDDNGCTVVDSYQY